jgi:hypothetical protein
MAALARPFLTLFALVAVAAALVPAGGARVQQTVLPSLYVEYTMNCTFSIFDDDRRRVTTIAPGTYQVFITSPVVFSAVDLSGIFDMTACKGFADFRLTGPGVNLTTTLQDGDEDKDTFKETFQPGATYTAVDLNQPQVARVVFATAATGAPAAPATPFSPSSSPGKPHTSVDPVGSKAPSVIAKSYPFRGALTAQVDVAGKVKLLFKGKAVGTLKEGRYSAMVTDSSKRAGLIFQLLGKNGQVVSSLTASKLAFTGKRTASLLLKKGQWGFLPTSSGKRNFFIVVG